MTEDVYTKATAKLADILSNTEDFNTVKEVAAYLIAHRQSVMDIYTDILVHELGQKE